MRRAATQLRHEETDTPRIARADHAALVDGELEQFASNLGEFVRTPEAARLLKVSPRTLEFWRHQGRGPRYMRVGARLAFYRVSDLKAYLESRVVGAE